MTRPSGATSNASSSKLRIATRGSALARWQAEHVGGLLGVPYELVLIETSGDRRPDVPLWELGGKGVFVKEVQAAVLDGRADVAVHSAKDLPAIGHLDLVLAVPERGDSRDALVGSRLADLPPGARIGTGSVRRRAQLTDLRPDLTFAGLRGNMHTRLERAAGFDAIVVAAAALQRLGLADRITETLSASMFVPQVAQGALAAECRRDDQRAVELLAGIEHLVSRRCVDAERAFLAELGGDCNLPAGAHAIPDGDHEQGPLTITAVLASLDGRIILRHKASGDEPVTLGRSVARHLLDGAGGATVLAG